MTHRVHVTSAVGADRRRRRYSRVRRALAGLACALPLSLSASGLQSSALAASAQPGMAGSGTGIAAAIRLPIDLGSNCAIAAQKVDSKLQVLVILLQVYAKGCKAPGTDRLVSSSGYWLVAYSTSTLKLVAAAPLALGTSGNCDASPSADASTLDPAHHQFLFVCGSVFPGFANQIFWFNLRTLLRQPASLAADRVIDIPSSSAQLASQAPGSVVAPGNPTGAAGDVSIIPSGLSLDPATNSAYLVLASFYGGTTSSSSAHGPASQDVYLARLSLGTGKVDWALSLDRCSFSVKYVGQLHAVGGSDPIFVLHRNGTARVVVGCITSRAPNVLPATLGQAAGSLVALTGGSMLTYQVPLDASAQPKSADITTRAGRPNVVSALGDPLTGRIFWVSSPPATSTGNQGGSTAVVYDSVHDVYLGAPTVGGPSPSYVRLALAGDRLYAADVTGVSLIDTSATPPGQGLRFPVFSLPAASAAADPVTRRLFVVPQGKAYIQVFQDNVPSIRLGDAPDPDSYTTQMRETPETTLAQFTGHSEAVAERIRLIGGMGGFLRGASFDLASRLPSQLNQPDTTADFSNREIRLGRVRSASLSNFEASAVATPATFDDVTKRQATGSASSPQPEAVCGGRGTATTRDSEGSTTSSVTCDLVKRTVRAQSDAEPVGVALILQGKPSSVPPVVSFGSGRSYAELRVDTTLGQLTAVSSEVRDATFGPVSIGHITAVSRCFAHGRTKTAGCTYVRSLDGVKLAGVPVGPGACTESFGASGGDTSTCNAVLAEMNAVLPGYLTFSMPPPDMRTGSLPGSPGGYQAVAQRELYKHLEDSVLNYDESTQIPGLQILYVNDSYTQPSRLDVQLANVQAEAHYGISPLPSGDDDGDGGEGVGPDVRGPGAVEAAGGPELTPAGDVQELGPAGGGGAGQVLRRALAGLRWLVRSPAQALLVACLLSLLAQPFLLAIRRARLQSLERVA